jgi:hypothetical protein
MTERLLLTHPRTCRINTPRDQHVLCSVGEMCYHNLMQRRNYLTVHRDLATCKPRIAVGDSDENQACYRWANWLALRCEPLYGCVNPNITMKLTPGTEGAAKRRTPRIGANFYIRRACSSWSRYRNVVPLRRWDNENQTSVIVTIHIRCDTQNTLQWKPQVT